jgi:hypothetical protein
MKNPSQILSRFGKMMFVFSTASLIFNWIGWFQMPLLQYIAGWLVLAALSTLVIFFGVLASNHIPTPMIPSKSATLQGIFMLFLGIGILGMFFDNMNLDVLISNRWTSILKLIGLCGVLILEVVYGFHLSESNTKPVL